MLVTLDMIKDLKKSGGKPGEYSGICPNCGERSFYINIYKNAYICFRSSCGIRGHLKDIGVDPTPIDHSFSDIKKKIDGLYTSNKNNSLVSRIDLDKISDPITPDTIKKYPFGYDYIKSRKLTDDDISKYKLRIGKEYYSESEDKIIKRWKGRIIFPFYEGGLPIYAIGRSYTGSKPKYLNTDGEKSVIVYNIDKIKNKTCIVCEGLISAIFAEKYSGISAVCILGCSISDFQFWQIRSLADKVYCSLDGGVDQYNLCKKFFMSGATTYRVDLPVIDGKGLDPDECGPEYRHYIENATRYRLI